MTLLSLVKEITDGMIKGTGSIYYLHEDIVQEVSRFQ